MSRDTAQMVNENGLLHRMIMDISSLSYIIRYMGLRWLLFRACYALKLRSGFFERSLPRISWDKVADSIEDEKSLEFIPDINDRNFQSELEHLDFLNSGKSSNVIEDAEAVLLGEYILFGFHRKHLGFPPEWHKNPFTGEAVPSDMHWSRISDFGQDDIKVLWEMSRFPWAFTLARAYARTQDDRYAEGFWLLFENWIKSNPPNSGVNWKCGQEATFRLMAAAFARKVFASSTATTHARLLQWRRFVLVTGTRIAGNLDYALSQKNNHGISECVGLLLAARLLLNSKIAPIWRRRALSALRRQVAELIYEDGSFSQHSAVYHRLILHDLVWYVAMEQTDGCEPDETILAAACRAGAFLREITDPITGDAPLCGSNDGANILVLSDAAYLDFRPVVQLVAAVLQGRKALASGPWDEAVLWLTNGRAISENMNAHAEERSFFSAPVGGWHMLHQKETRLFIHAPERFRHRPSQADVLHVDVWWQGLPIAHDAGSFSYNAQGPFAGMLKETSVHNTVEVDGQEQMQRISRFMVVPWPRAEVSYNETMLTIHAAHHAYDRMGVLHSRLIKPHGRSGWIVKDKLSITGTNNTKTHQFRLHWLLGDWPYRFEEREGLLTLETAMGKYVIRIYTDAASWQSSLVRADQRTHRGWWSPCYLAAAPALSLAVVASSELGVHFTTIFESEE